MHELYEFARTLPYLKCNHVDGLTPAECFKDLIGKNNQERYWVLSQDEELREFFKSMYPVPAFFISKDLKFTMEEPNNKCQKEVQSVKINIHSTTTKIIFNLFIFS